MKDWRLEELLRYGFSGGSLLVVVVLIHRNWWHGSLARAGNLAGPAILLGAALLLGSLIYTLHRAIAYRIMFALAVFILTCCGVYNWEVKAFLPLVPSETELRIDRWRLALRRREDPIDAYTSEWGAQVNLLYCTAWAILLGMGLASLFPDPQSVISHTSLLAASAVVAVAAFWHHVRLLWWINANEEQNFSKSPKPS